MVKKKETEKVTKKTKETKEETINLEAIKQELTDYINQSIKKEFTSELDKSYRRIIKDKNKKIIIKNMIITSLLLIIVCLIFTMNKYNYFDKFFIEDNQSNEINNNKELKDLNNANVPKEEIPSLEELTTTYSYLLDNLYINENSSYITDFYNGNLTPELKNYLTLNYLDIEALTTEDNYQIIDNELFSNEYSKHFETKYQNKTFNYNGNLIRYINKLNSYLSDNLINENTTNIIKVITDIKLSDKYITITTTEALLNDDKLYNIITTEEITTDPEDILSYTDKLNTLIYTFDKQGKLISISK